MRLMRSALNRCTLREIAAQRFDPNQRIPMLGAFALFREYDKAGVLEKLLITIRCRSEKHRYELDLELEEALALREFLEGVLPTGRRSKFGQLMQAEREEVGTSRECRKGG